MSTDFHFFIKDLERALVDKAYKRYPESYHGDARQAFVELKYAALIKKLVELVEEE